MSKYVRPYVVGFQTNDNDEVAGKIFRGLDAKEKSKEFYLTLVENGLNCFRAEMREEHGEG